MSLERRRRASRVGTYLGPRAFYTKDTARRNKAAQRTALPPRCVHCRLPGRIVLDGVNDDGVIVGVPHCEDHTPCVNPGCAVGRTDDTTRGDAT